ncbi:MAG: EAL domain-containing protein [Lachnospiraceae bacterium]|nr:EAL domain-containing protein [Lachnospiraceae bacterium]
MKSRGLEADTLKMLSPIQDGFTGESEERDVVTQGLNHTGFFRYGKQILEESKLERRFAIVVFNLKGFRAINEFFGMSGGDELLQKMYHYFCQSSLKPLLTARIEQDIFACLVDCEYMDYSCLADLCETVFTKEEKSIHVYTRCGIYLIEDKKMNVNTMCEYAKIAIHYIVDEYSKPYAVFQESMRTKYLIQSEVQESIQKALENDEFQLYYQPIFDAKTKEVASAEALVRWNHPQNGIIMPQVFIPILEESGQITSVDDYVFRKVKDFLKSRKQQEKLIVPVSVNISGIDFYDDTFMKFLQKELQDNKEQNIDIHVEVTETSHAALLEREDDLLDTISGAGTQLYLDDFGSGYSSFSTVRDYDFDVIKLDMGFVKKIGTSSENKVKGIIYSMIDLFHQMDVKVIAEGVENKNQLDFLTQYGCDYIQGYYFSKPLTQEQFARFLDENPHKEITPTEKKKLSVTELIDLDVLQKFQDAFSDMTGMAALMTDRNGVAVTKGSNFTDFCMKYTRNSELGEKRCEICDRQGAKQALLEGKSCAYQCHAGLIDYAAPIMANGEMIGCFIGGQILSEKADIEKYVGIAKELGINEDAYIDAVSKVNVVEKEKIDSAANFLYITANILSNIAYNKYMLDIGNDMLKKKNMELDYMANHDKLTGLSNRHHIQEYFQKYEKSGNPYCIIIGDIDNFKKINDTYGHAYGDMVLCKVADILKENLSDKSVPCRWGGEEFLILAYGEKAQVVQRIDVIRNKIQNMELVHNEQCLQITMTFGVASNGEKANRENLITLADSRLYYGKKHGKNQIVSENNN